MPALNNVFLFSFLWPQLSSHSSIKIWSSREFSDTEICAQGDNLVISCVHYLCVLVWNWMHNATDTCCRMKTVESNSNHGGCAVNCDKCGNDYAYFQQIQIRSADEPMTTFYRCARCAYRWRQDWEWGSRGLDIPGQLCQGRRCTKLAPSFVLSQVPLLQMVIHSVSMFEMVSITHFLMHKCVTTYISAWDNGDVNIVRSFGE